MPFISPQTHARSSVRILLSFSPPPVLLLLYPPQLSRLPESFQPLVYGLVLISFLYPLQERLLLLGQLPWHPLRTRCQLPHLLPDLVQDGARNASTGLDVHQRRHHKLHAVVFGIDLLADPVILRLHPLPLRLGKLALLHHLPISLVPLLLELFSAQTLRLRLRLRLLPAPPLPLPPSETWGRISGEERILTAAKKNEGVSSSPRVHMDMLKCLKWEAKRKVEEQEQERRGEGYRRHFDVYLPCCNPQRGFSVVLVVVAAAADDDGDDNDMDDDLVKRSRSERCTCSTSPMPHLRLHFSAWVARNFQTRPEIVSENIDYYFKIIEDNPIIFIRAIVLVNYNNPS
eukprot:762434-Hanusia_phi.AAC.3